MGGVVLGITLGGPVLNALYLLLMFLLITYMGKVGMYVCIYTGRNQRTFDLVDH